MNVFFAFLYNFILSAVYINTYGLYKRNELLENARMWVVNARMWAVNSYWTNININSLEIKEIKVEMVNEHPPSFLYPFFNFPFWPSRGF